MAEEAVRLAIPAAFNSLDEDCYANAAGAPTHAALGRQIARNDRLLHANLRRTLVDEAWPVASPPKLCRYHGVRIGPYPAPTTPGVKAGEWRLRIKPEANAVLSFIPWVDPDMPYPGAWQGMPGGYTHTDGGGAAEATVGPFTVPLRSQFAPPLMSGVVVVSHLVAGSPTVGSVKSYTADQIQSTAGSFNALASPTCRVIRLSNSATGEVYAGWRDIVDVRTIDNAGDVAGIWPPLGPADRGAGPNLQWEMRSIWSGALYTASFREKPLTGSLAEAT